MANNPGEHYISSGILQLLLKGLQLLLLKVEFIGTIAITLTITLNPNPNPFAVVVTVAVIVCKLVVSFFAVGQHVDPEKRK